MKKTEKGTHHVVFQPTFGNRPDQYISCGRVLEGTKARRTSVCCTVSFGVLVE